MSIRNNCGDAIPSSCVPFTGDKPSFIAEIDFPCDVNLDDIIKQFAITIQSVLDAINLKLTNKRCLDYDPATATVKDVIQLENDKLCALQAQLDTLLDGFNDLDISTKLVTLDLKCLTPVNNPCSLNANQYSLFYILSTLVNEVCAIKTNLGI